MASRTKRAPREPARSQPSQSDSSSLQAEINLLREMVHQVGALAEAGGPVNEQVRLLDAVGRACEHLARLLRAQEELGGEGGNPLEEIGRITEELRQEMASRANRPK